MLERASLCVAAPVGIGAKLAAVRDTGYNQVAIQIVQGQDHAIDAWADVIGGFERND